MIFFFMKDKIFKFVSERGPILSKDVSRHFAITSTYSGAYLSELIQDKKLLFSHIKVGTSPLYFTPEQKPKITSLFEHMNSKDKETFNLLHEKKVLRDNQLPTISRVSLRNLKDFAYPISVTIKGQKEIFWKWFTLSNEEVYKFIQPQKEEEPQKEEKPSKESEQEKLIKLKHLLDEEKKALENEKILLKQQLIESENKFKKDFEEKLKESANTANSNEIEELKKIIENDRIKYEKHISELESNNVDDVKKNYEAEINELKLQLNQDEVFTNSSEIKNESDEFLLKCKVYFEDKNIEIISYNIIKQDSEIEFMLNVPSVLGKSDFYCRAKNKKRCNEGDLSTAFVSGQIKKLPTLFLSPGDITKKSQSMLLNEFKNTLFYKKLE